MTSYLHIVADYFARQAGEQVSQYTFVFPNQRAGLFFRKYLGQAVGKVMLPPKITTIDACFHQLSDLHLADRLTLLMMLYNIYHQLRPSEESLEDFLVWGQMMLADFSEIDNHLVPNVEALFTAISDLKDLEGHYDYLSDNQRNALKSFWGRFIESAEKHAYLAQDPHEHFMYTWNVLYPVYSQLRAKLLQAGLAYEGMIHRDVIESFDSIDAERFDTHYVFIGFNALTRSEEQLMLRLKQMGRAEFFFDYDQSFLCDTENRASLFMQHNIDLFGTAPESVRQQISHQMPEIHWITTSSTVGEVQEVYRILETLFTDRKETDYTRTAVVLPDESLLILLLHALPECVDKINVTMGYPVRSTQEYVPVIYPERYFSDGDEQSARDLLEGLRKVWEEMDPEGQSETVAQLQNTLNRVEDVLLHQDTIPISRKALLQIIKMLTLDMTIPYTGEPLDGLQVMGVLETRALDFDHLILTGFNDDLYPGATRGNSFVPYTLRKGFGLPTPERQDAILAYNFYRMLSYAQVVYLITDGHSDDMHSGEVSRYLYQLQYQYPHIPIHRYTVMTEPGMTRSGCAAIEKDAVVMSKLDTYFGSKKVSPSALNKYLRCPKSFYYRFVEGLPEPEEQTDEVNEKEVGNAFHDTVYMLYAEYIGKTIDGEAIERMRHRKRQEWEQWQTLEPVRRDAIATEIVSTYIDRLLDADDEQVPFELIALEQPLERTLVIEDRQVIFYGKADRIDRKDGIVRVIDYKTGSAETSFRDVGEAFGTDKSPYALQTLTYCWMYANNHLGDVLAPHIYAIRQMTPESALDTLVHPTTVKDGSFVFNQVDGDVEDGLKHLLATVMDPAQPFAPAEEARTCERCPFADLCQA